MRSNDAPQQGLLQNREVPSFHTLLSAPGTLPAPLSKGPHERARLPRVGLAGLLARPVFWALVLFTAWLPGAARAQAPTAPLELPATGRQPDLQPFLSFMLDPGGTLDVEQVDNQPGSMFAPARAGTRYLTGYGALWLRFDATAASDSPHWRMTVPLPGVDDVTLYYRDATGRWVSQTAGDTKPMSQWAQPARYPVFTLSSEVGRPVRYYLQVRHPRIPFSAMPRVVNDVQLVNTSQTEHMLLGVYFGLAALVVVMASINALAYRDAGFGSYALYIAAFGAAQASFTGVAGLYWWPEWAWASRSTIFLLPLSAASAMLFVRVVSAPQRYSRLLDRILLALIIILPLAGTFDARWPTPFTYTMMNSLVGTSLLVVAVTMGVALAAGDRHTRWLLAGFTPVMVATLFPLMRNFNLIASSVLSDYALLFGSAIEVPILFYGLHRRVAQRRDLLTRTSGLGEHDPLTGLDSSPAFLGKLRQSLATAERYKLPFAVLVVHLANHEALQKTHGREVADRAIVMAASRIRGVAHSTDALARWGDTQFALLMEGPIDAPSANDVATRILASGLRPSNQLPDAEPLQFHIAVGHLDGLGNMASSEAESCMTRLVQGVRALNDGSRKAIRIVKL